MIASSPASYPAVAEFHRTVRFERSQVLFRLMVLVVLGILHQSVGSLFGALYLVLPLLAAAIVAQKGGARFLYEDRRWIVPLVEWTLAFAAYMSFVSDRFPLDPRIRAVRLHVRPSGMPTVGGALARLVTSVPHALVLGLLGLVSGVLAVVIAVSVLLTEHNPEALRAFQRDVVSWAARLFAYHVSLVETYPPFSLGSERERHAASA